MSDYDPTRPPMVYSRDGRFGYIGPDGKAVFPDRTPSPKPTRWQRLKSRFAAAWWAFWEEE